MRRRPRPYFQQQQVDFDRHRELGAIKMKRGQLAAAVSAFKKALEMDPTDGETNRYLAAGVSPAGPVFAWPPSTPRARRRRVHLWANASAPRFRPARPKEVRGREMTALARLVAIALLLSPTLLMQPPRSAADARGRFADVTAKARIDFVHKSGASPEKYMVETFGSGLAWIDYDNDGFPDLYFVNGAPGHVERALSQQPGRHVHRRDRSRRRRGEWQHGDAAAKAYKTGVAVGDYDNDGYLDLYVTAFGPNILFRNNGDGTFT